MIESFEPIVDENAELLILGSMPSVKSLETRRYYGNKQNQFWKIVYKLFGMEAEEDYEARKLFLKAHKIALWDVLKSCIREGSSDSKIKNPDPNEFQKFFAEYPGIKKIYFNGAKSEELFFKLVAPELEAISEFELKRLPSTSPANTMPFSEKLKQWEDVVKK